MSRAIDLNVDIGEGYPSDAALMALASTCNIACGGHAGDKDTMRAALRLAIETNTRCGAHPSYPDREGFGRRRIDLPPEALEASLREQMSQLARYAAQAAIDLGHVKPHGALYNDCADNLDLARLVVGVIKETLPDSAIFGLPDSALTTAAGEHHVRFFAEGFADRVYEPDGRLRSRSSNNSVLDDPSDCAAQALRLARNGQVQCSNGDSLAISVQTICLHGDGPNAAVTAKTVLKKLTDGGIAVCPIT